MFLLLMLFLLPSFVSAQEIDCTQQQSQVNDFDNEISNAQMAQAKAKKNLDECLNVQSVMAKPEYQQAVAAIANAKSEANWENVNAISSPAINP